jgi:hypothetical protein
VEGTVGDDDNAAWASAATRLCGNSPRQHQPNAPHQQHADRHPTLEQVTALQPDFAEALSSYPGMPRAAGEGWDDQRDGHRGA